ncbi:MAG: PAS domain-containing protein [Elusimicrobia bacterium]|nr:PAS domain-containing protein [Elusimicrobiota bacterium]
MSESPVKARQPIASARRFLQTLSQAIKLVSLYRPAHPVAAGAVLEAWHQAVDLFAETGWIDASIARVEDRWLVNDLPMGEGERVFEVLGMAFKGHALRSLTIEPALKLYEVSAFCELASTPANRVYENDAADFLQQRGVRHLRVNVEEYARKPKRRPVDVRAVSPISAPAPASSASAPQAPAAAARGFGSFIKSLVEEAVADPAQRTQVYEEATRLVREALARHVHGATVRLQAERQRSVNERDRSERVMNALADGKVIVDKTGRVLMMDPVAEELAGAPLSRIAGKPFMEGLAAGDRLLSLAEELEVPDNRSISANVRIAGPEEIIEAVRRSMAVVQDETGRLVGAYAAAPHERKLKEALRMQEDFVSNVTHELKAPLAALCSALEAVQGRPGLKLPAQEARLLEIGMRNARALRQLIDEILDFSRIKGGRMGVKPERVAADELLRECAEGLRPWAVSRRQSLDIASVPEGLFVLADRARAVQILNNLVSNAIKYAGEGKRIGLGAARGEGPDAGAAVFSVGDDGPGIAPEDLERIFEKFSQVGVRREGVGLGLAIVRDLVALHRGRVWVDSEPGKGSIFRFTLPLAQA